jgi:Tol biopolymer transport system component
MTRFTLALTFCACISPQRGIAQGAATESVDRRGAGGSPPKHQRSESDTTPRRVWAGRFLLLGLYRGKGIAPDGSFVVAEDYGNLLRIDVPSGRVRTIVTKPTPAEYAFAAVVSPDGRRVAYSWFDGNYFDLRVVDANGGTPRVITSADSSRVALGPYDWSPDGRSIAIYVGRNDGTFQIALASAEDGSVRALKDLGRWIPGNLSFSPDGRFLAYDFRGAGRSLDLGVVGVDGNGDTLLLGGAPQDQGPMWSHDGKSIVFVSDRGGRTSLWSVPVDNARAVAAPTPYYADSAAPIGFFERTGTPIGFVRNGDLYFFKWKPNPLDVYSVSAEATGSRLTTRPETLSKRFMGGNSFAAWSRDEKRVAFVSERAGGKRVMVLHDMTSGAERDLDAAPYTPVAWFPDDTSLLAYGTKATGGDALFRVDVTTGGSKYITDIKEGWQAFPTLSAHGDTVTFLQRDYAAKENQVWAYAIGSGQKKMLLRFPLPPMVTSFARSPDGKSLALIGIFQQERGRPSALRVVDVADGTTRDLFKESWGDDTKFSGVAWSPDGKSLYFVRKTEDYRNEEIWRAEVATGRRERTGIEMRMVRFPRLSPSARAMVFHGSSTDKEVELWVKPIR